MIQRLSELDVASGTMLGYAAAPPRLPDDGLSARQALERAILPGLLQPPCLVSFSGGRDSSAVLAVATSLARREGLDLPIPATNLFPQAPHSAESDWQAAVIEHLGLVDWVRLAHHDELDIVGPYAERVLERHGLLMPCNVHFHLPLLDLAAGGSLLTGVGGDEIFTALRRSVPVRRRPRSALRLGAHQIVRRGPRVLVTAMANRQELDLPWLRPDARRQLARLSLETRAHEPRSLHRRVEWWRALRYLNEGRDGLARLAEDAGVRLIHPLLDRRSWAALAREAHGGYLDRTEAMVAIFGDLLPAATLRRTSKSHFDEALWTDRARGVAEACDGSGVPTDVVDPEALRQIWAGPEPSAQTFTLLQSVRLASMRRDAIKEKVDGALV